jgi:hypothetical protein
MSEQTAVTSNKEKGNPKEQMAKLLQNIKAPDDASKCVQVPNL